MSFQILPVKRRSDYIPFELYSLGLTKLRAAAVACIMKMTWKLFRAGLEKGGKTFSLTRTKRYLEITVQITISHATFVPHITCNRCLSDVVMHSNKREWYLYTSPDAAKQLEIFVM